MDWILENSSWLFSGIGVAILSALFGLRKLSKGNEETSSSSAINITNTVTTSIGSEVGCQNNKQPNKRTYLERNQISILFIDDQKFDYVKILKNAGYENTRRISDARSIDCPEVLHADIVFVDINGVGTQLFPTEQGLGLAKAIKKKYTDSKCVILYSASQQPLNPEFFTLDGVLNKNAEPYEFINLIENWRIK